jgi:hypothetical protein
MNEVSVKAKLSFTIQQQPRLRDYLGHFGREDEICRSFAISTLDCGSRSNSVVRGINFNGLEFGSVVAEMILRFHLRWLEAASPSCRCKCRRSG